MCILLENVLAIGSVNDRFQAFVAVIELCRKVDRCGVNIREAKMAVFQIGHLFFV